VVQVDTESEQSAVTSSPFFQVVRRGYDCTQVDAYIPELFARMAAAEQARAELQREIARLREQPTPTFEQLGEEAATVLQEAGRSAELLIEKARRRAESIVEQATEQSEQMRRDGTSEAQAVLAEAHQAAEHLRQEVEQERAVLYAETAGIREYRDGLTDHLGRVHADISTLLERTLKRKAQKAPAAEGTSFTSPSCEPPLGSRQRPGLEPSCQRHFALPLRFPLLQREVPRECV
jgi:cell division septum initiation protein DivIVA